MITKEQKQLFIFSSILVLAIVLMIVIRRKNISDEVEKIKEAIKTGKGVNFYDIDSVLSRINPDISFLEAGNEAVRLKEANKPWWQPDDDATVSAVVQNKTKAQLKQISNELIKITGLTLGQFVNDIFSDISDTGKIQRIFLTVKNAR